MGQYMFLCGMLSLVTMEAADEFFATREEVYKCQEHQDLKCQYKIMKWQADSVDWTERVQKVMRKK